MSLIWSEESFVASSCVMMRVMVALVRTPRVLVFQKGAFMWCPYVIRVTTGTFRCLTSLPKDGGSTALVPQSEYLASGYTAAILPLSTTVFK